MKVVFIASLAESTDILFVPIVVLREFKSFVRLMLSLVVLF